MKPVLVPIAALVLILSPAIAAVPSRHVPTPESSTAKTGDEHAATPDAYVSLPPVFVPNEGQLSPEVDYAAQTSGYSFAFGADSARLGFRRGDRSASLDLEFVGARPGLRPVALNQTAGKVNYLIGNDPAKWLTDLPTYERIRYGELWPGIDLTFRGDPGRLKYELQVRPGARPQDIRLRYTGADSVALAPVGDLLLSTPLGVLTDARPFSYQELDGRRTQVDSGYVLKDNGEYGFAVGAYDATRPLVIDPGLFYSTFLGGTSGDQVQGITVDATGNAYVTGYTLSTNLPTSLGAFHSGFAGTQDVFVTKLNPAGTSFLYSTYVGGTNADIGYGIAVDASGNAYVVGTTSSSNFPQTLGCGASTFNADAFVTKLNSTGSALVYSRCIGGTGGEQGFAITIDATGSAYLTGYTTSLNFPATPGASQMTLSGNGDAYVAKLNSLGGIAYATYLGGTGNLDQGFAIAIDATGNTYVTGYTNSTNFPTSIGASQTAFGGGSSDAYVTKLNTTGSVRLYSTYLGGSGADEGRGVVVDGTGNAYVTGITGSSTNFPTTVGAYQTSYGGGSSDAFITKLDATGTARLFSTYLGASGLDAARGIALDAMGNLQVTGYTTSAMFPTTAGAYDTSFNGVYDVFVSKVTATGTTLLYSTFIGGSSLDIGYGLTVDATGTYVGGFTADAGFPITAGAAQATYAGQGDGFILKLLTVGTPATLILSPPAATNTVGTPHTVTATVTDVTGQPVPDVTVRFTVSGANPTTRSCVTDINGQCTVSYTGTHAGTDAITAYADTNGNGSPDAGEPTGAATKEWLAGPPAILTLMPVTDTNTVGEQHCVTATVTDLFLNPVEGVTVSFSVPTHILTFAHPYTGSDTTDANGEATFCFTASLPGIDTIHAYADTNNNTMEDLGEPSDDATKIWTPPASTSFCEVTVTEGGWITTIDGDRASFGGNAKVTDDGSTVQGQEEFQDHGPADPMDLHSIELLATMCTTDSSPQTATIFGRATIDGSGDYMFRIDVSDGGPGGSNDSYGIIVSTGYMSGQQPLDGGNVTIHKS